VRSVTVSTLDTVAAANATRTQDLQDPVKPLPPAQVAVHEGEHTQQRVLRDSGAIGGVIIATITALVLLRQHSES
jgi:hypothetical protein